MGFSSTRKESAPSDRPGEKKLCEKGELINRARKQLDYEYASRQMEIETEIREAKAELSLAKPTR